MYKLLKAAAEAHRSSLNAEILLCLERVLRPTRVSTDERLSRARRLRSDIKPAQFRIVDIDEAIGQGRR